MVNDANKDILEVTNPFEKAVKRQAEKFTADLVKLINAAIEAKTYAHTGENDDGLHEAIRFREAQEEFIQSMVDSWKDQQG